MTTVRRVRRVASDGVVVVGGGVVGSGASIASTTRLFPGGRRGGDGAVGVGMIGTGTESTSLSERLRLQEEESTEPRRPTTPRRGPMLDADHPRTTTTTTKERETVVGAPMMSSSSSSSSSIAGDTVDSGGWSWASSAIGGSRGGPTLPSIGDGGGGSGVRRLPGDGGAMIGERMMMSAMSRCKRRGWGGTGRHRDDGEEEEEEDDGIGDDLAFDRERRRYPLVTARIGLPLIVLVVLVLAGGALRSDRRGDDGLAKRSIEDAGGAHSSEMMSSSSSSKKKKTMMMMTTSKSALSTGNGGVASSSTNDDDDPRSTSAGIRGGGDSRHDVAAFENDEDDGDAAAADAYLSHLSDARVPYDPAGGETPYFWDVHFSGESIAEHVFAKCHDLVQACEFGLRQQDYNEDKLETFVLDGAQYVNVDTTTKEGIERASRLGLARSQLADVVIGPHFRDMSSRVFSTRHPGRMFALFRHPVDRAVSMYHYLAKASWDPHYNPALSKMTIEQYAKSGYIENNWMTRFLANRPGGKLDREDMLLAKTIVESKCLVGLYEDIDVSLARFARFFGWERPKNNSTAARSAADVVRCRSEAVARGDGHVSGKPSGNNGVMSTVRPGSLAWNAIVRMNAFDMELYEYAKRVYQTQAEEIFDVVGYELPSPVVASAAAGIGNVARSKSMNEGSMASASSQLGKREEFDSLDEDRRANGHGGGSVAAAADFGSATNVAKDANAVKSMAKGAVVAKGAVKSMAKDFVEERVDESTFAGAGNKVVGDAFKVGIPALRMGDVVGVESEPVPTAKKMMLDAGGMH